MDFDTSLETLTQAGPEALTRLLPQWTEGLRELDEADEAAFEAKLRVAIAEASATERLATLDALCSLYYDLQRQAMERAIASDSADGMAAALGCLLSLKPAEVPNQGPFRDTLRIGLGWYLADRARPADRLLAALDTAILRWCAPADPILDVLCDLADFHFHAVWSFEASSAKQCAYALPGMLRLGQAMARTRPPRPPQTTAAGAVHVGFLAMYADPAAPITVALRHLAPALLRDGRFRLTVYAWSDAAPEFLDWLRSLGAVCHLVREARPTAVVERVEELAAQDPPSVLISDMNTAVPTAVFARRLAPVQVFLQGGLPAWPVPNLDAVLNSFGFDPVAAGWLGARILGFETPWDLAHLNPPERPEEVAAERAGLSPALRWIGNYGRLVKVTEPCLRAAERILQSCPDVGFVTGGSGDGRAIRDFFARSPVGDRMVLVERFVPGHSWGQILEVFLDTWPLTGGESAREMIAKGRPVVCMHSEEMPALDLQRDPSLLATDWDGYVERAVHLLQDPVAHRAACARASALATRLSDPGPFSATLAGQLEALVAHAGARAADPRRAFDAAQLPGMRQRLASYYASFRGKEAAVLVQQSVPGFVPYRQRDCPSCGLPPGARQPAVLTARGLDLLACRRCGLTYSRQVMDDAVDAARYLASDLDRESLRLRTSGPYLELEAARDRYYLHRLVQGGLTPARLLEVGCGTGTLLLEAEAAGWQALGIEPGLAAQQVARERGATVVGGYFPQALPADATPVEAIALLDVLEHFADPRALLAQLRPALLPGGRLLVQVPNWDSLLIRLEGGAGSTICPGHWSYFTPRSLTSLLEREGFRTLSVETVLSEMDRILAYPPERVMTQLRALRPGTHSLPDAAGLMDLGLGYKLMGVFAAP